MGFGYLDIPKCAVVMAADNSVAPPFLEGSESDSLAFRSWRHAPHTSFVVEEMELDIREVTLAPPRGKSQEVGSELGRFTRPAL